LLKTCRWRDRGRASTYVGQKDRNANHMSRERERQRNAYRAEAEKYMRRETQKQVARLLIE